MGNIRKTVFLVILLATILVTGCGTINLELNASSGGDLPSSEVKAKLEFRDYAKAHIVMDAVGEQYARDIVAERFRMWEDPYSASIIKVTDKNDDDWYALYVRSTEVLNDLNRIDSREETREEIALEDFLSKVTNPRYPFIMFSEEPILEDLEF